MTNGNGADVEVVFFDVRDTLGEVDRPGHLVPYRPSTQKLLEGAKTVGVRIGVITNLPDDVTADMGREMLRSAVLAEDEKTKQQTTIADFLDPDGIVINHEAGASKPDARIYRYAADKMGVLIEQCVYIGENLIEVMGAQAAGMQTQLKPCPPGREFQPAVITKLGETIHDSGRAFEHFFEHEHLLGERIFACGSKIVEGLKPLKEGDAIPDGVLTAMSILIFLVNHFADQAHLRAEEAVIPLAVARGMDPRHAEWVLNDHEQARAYWASMTVAWRRIQAGDPDDVYYAIGDFWRSTEAFVILFKHHADRENDQLYPEMGRHFSDGDDTLVMGLLAEISPRDFTPYVGLVADMEQALGIPSPPV
jgi:FMN phosphatase YigB (HAD superfamily)/hemerythrin-like domain-containing protein